MSNTVAITSFVRRQTPESQFTHWTISDKELLERVIGNIDKAHPQVRYLLGSGVHPTLLDKLEGADIALWHIATPEHVKRFIPELNESTRIVISGGGSVGLRAISLLYRAWAKYRQPVQQERTILRGVGTEWDDGAARPRDAITAAVACLVGLGGRGLGGTMAIDDAVVFRYAGHYSHFPRCAESLELLLTDLYGVPVQVHQFIGRWLDLEKPDQTRLGTREHPDGWNTQLGSMAIAGSRVWSVQSVLEITAGPLSLEQFRRRLPGTRELAKLGDLARLDERPP
jgi:hypothetical protein